MADAILFVSNSGNRAIRAAARIVTGWAMPAVEEILTNLLDKHFASISEVPWSAHAENLYRLAPGIVGESFAERIDGAYYEISEHVEWIGEAGGDILLTVETFTDPEFPPAFSVRRTAVIRKPA